jgi:glycosyltransferase involved in cell wall biosynthesis
MKIILINKFLYPKGGDAISTITTGNILAARGHEVHYWGMDHPDNPSYPYRNFFVSYVDYDSSKGIIDKVKSSMNILYSFEARRKMLALLKKIKPDIVHLNNFAHQISPSILDAIKEYNIPTVMTMHDYKLVCPAYSLYSKGKTCEKCQLGRYYKCFINRCTKGSFFKSLVNVAEMYLHHNILRIYDMVDIYISPSRFLKEKVEAMSFKGDIVYLPNCVHLNEFQSAHGWKEKSIIYLGRLSQEKGVGTLIEAMKGITNIRLKIIGDGPLKNDLKEKVRCEGIGNIEFLGYRSGENLHDEIKRSMFIVIPSECYENNPRAVIEGFALGKPAIGARIGGIPELIRDWDTGLTYSCGSVSDLKKKIQLMLDNPGKIQKMGKKARKYIEQELNDKVHYKHLMEIYKMASQKSAKNKISMIAK